MLKPSMTIKKTKRGTSIELKNISMKPEELHAIVESAKKEVSREP